MRRFLTLATVFAILAGSSYTLAAKQSKEDWPTTKQIYNALAEARFDQEKQGEAKYRGKFVRFLPCKIGDLEKNQKDRGIVLGRLSNNGPSADNLPAGTYIVLARRHNDQWEVFFCQNNEAVAKSTEVKERDEKGHVDFEAENTAIRYWRLQFAW